jgi:hypothetical protein
MASLAEIRQQYPAYADMPDGELADKLYQKFYSDMPRGDFNDKIGLRVETPASGQSVQWDGQGWVPAGSIMESEAPSTPEGGGMFGRRSFDAAEALSQTWPARLAKTIVSGVTLPGDVANDPRFSPGPVVDEQSYINSEAAKAEMIKRSADLAVVPNLTTSAVGILGRPLGPGGALMTGARGTPAAASRAPLVEAAQRIGVSIPKAAATDSMVVQRIGQAVANIPIGGGALRKAGERAVTQTGEAAGRVAAGYGGGSAASPLSAGATARESLERYIGPTTSARVDKAYDAVDALVRPDVSTPLDSTARIATTIVTQRKAAGLRGGGPAVDLIAEAASRPEGLTYQGIKTLRTRVGEMLKGGILPADMSQAELKRIYGALSDDLRAAVEGAGGAAALAKFERANIYNALISQRREELARIVGVKNDEGVYERLAKAAGSTSSADMNLLLKARKAIPGEEWDEVASAVIQRMGRNPGQAMEFSPEAFMTAFRKLSPGGRKVLFRSTGKGNLADALDDVAMVSSRFKELSRFSNPSGTAQVSVGIAQLGGTSGVAFGLVDPITFAGSLLGTGLLARALASPATARATAGYGRAYNLHVKNPSRMTAQALSFASRRLAAEIGTEFGLGSRVPQMAAGLEGGPGNATAEDQ